MFNFLDNNISSPIFERQLRYKGNLVTLFNCPIGSKFADIWCHQSYIIYVMEGRKIWHTPHGSYDLRKGSCVYVRKGASMVEQFFDAKFCMVIFFVTDEFICDVLRSKNSPIYKADKKYQPVIAVDSDESLHAFFLSMIPLFDAGLEPDSSLIELKFRELILIMAGNTCSSEMLSYFFSLLNAPQTVSLQDVMDDNYCFNLKLEEYARLSNRSLSAFKRDFQKHYQTTPGKWLIEKRLDNAMNLLINTCKNVSEAAFESGFENPSHFSRAFRQRFGTTAATVIKQAELA